MAGCDVNIVANSSFSWWGAYLNPAADVYAPSRWFGPAMDPPNDRQDDIVPPELAHDPRVRRRAARVDRARSHGARDVSKRALIVGITGQDGSFLAELLLAKGYEVFGTLRRSSSFNTGRIDHIYQDPHEADRRLHLIYADLTDGSSLNRILRDVRPDEIYNLGAQSHVRVSFDIPEYTERRRCDSGHCACWRASATPASRRASTRRRRRSSSARSRRSRSRETTPFYPRSPYGVAKVYAHWMTVNYRESYGMHASCGILFNHESERRGETFVSRKITRAAAAIKLGLQDVSTSATSMRRRDWGYAKDYVEAMWLMLQADAPDDYVVATGTMHSVRDLLDEAFGHLGLDWNDYVEIDPRYFRPAEVDELDLTLGQLMQTAAAFAQVQVALNWLFDNYPRIAEWLASAGRVTGLWTAFTQLDASVGQDMHDRIVITDSPDDTVRLEDLSVAQYNGRVMINEASTAIAPGRQGAADRRERDGEEHAHPGDRGAVAVGVRAGADPAGRARGVPAAAGVHPERDVAAGAALSDHGAGA